MTEESFPQPVTEVISTLSEIFREQGENELMEICDSSHTEIEMIDFDNWNGGTYNWALRLQIPVPLYAAVQSRVEPLEQSISKSLGYLEKIYPNHHISAATITPLSKSVASSSQRLSPSLKEIERIWPVPGFRLFLSHLAKHKVEISKLKLELRKRGICAFVAHEDIEPTIEWMDEIERALRSMDGLAAFLTDGFKDSIWTDQEIGWALGRGILVIPVRLGLDPYGFAGRFQGVSGSFKNPHILAERMVEILLKHKQTHGAMRRALVKSFKNSQSFKMTQALIKHILEIDSFSEEEIQTLKDGCINNSEVKNAYFAPEKIAKKFGPIEKQEDLEEEDIPF